MIKHTGLWLKKVRIANHLKQREACEYFKVSRGTYSSWESRYKTKILPKSVLNNDGLLLMKQHNKQKSWFLRAILRILYLISKK